MADAPTIPRTRAAVTAPPPFSPTHTITPSVAPVLTTTDVVSRVGALRNDVRILSEDVNDSYAQACILMIRERVSEMANRSAMDLLSELANQGLSWRDIARVLKVSVPAVRQWRMGATLRGENRLALARLVALVSLLEDIPVADVASWLEMPLATGIPVSKLDLLAEGADVELCELAQWHVTEEELLDRYRPGWRTRYESNFEVFEAEDGQLGLRSK
jgi:hypothetical protein